MQKNINSIVPLLIVRKKAKFTTEQVVTNILNNIVAKVSIKDSGKFLNFDGTEHPW